MQREEKEWKDEKGYDVVRFIEHGGKCRPAMDYVRGANFNWTSSDGEKRYQKAFISMVSDAVYPAGYLSSK